MRTDDAKTRFLRDLVDDAGLFPPARLPMAEAVAGHVRARQGPYAWIQGRFLCPASRLPELAGVLADSSVAGPDAAPAVRTVGVILDRQASDDWETAIAADIEAATAFSAETAGVRIDVVETPLPATDASEVADAVAALLRRLPPGVAPHLEVPAARPQAVKGIATARAEAHGAAPGAKIRCGGLSPDAFPPPEAVAAFLTTCAQSGVAAKATAGLHHPIRHHDDENGWWEHGFVNVAGAAILAAGGEGEATVTRLLADDDPEAFALDGRGFSWRGRPNDVGAVAAGRALLVAYGSCSFDEPIEGLTDLGILP